MGSNYYIDNAVLAEKPCSGEAALDYAVAGKVPVVNDVRLTRVGELEVNSLTIDETHDGGGDPYVIHYSDKPEHENAVAVVLVWHSKGTLADIDLGHANDPDSGSSASGRSDIDPNETEEDRIERQKAEAYYCKRATQIYDSYLNAPQLYKTSEDGEKVYLTDEEAKATLSETKVKVDALCG